MQLLAVIAVICFLLLIRERKLHVVLKRKFAALLQANQEVVQERNALADKKLVLEDIIAIIAHDVRSPLNIIKTYSFASSEKVQRRDDGSTNFLREQIKEVCELIDQLLLFAHTSYTSLTEQLEQIELTSIIDESIKLLKPQAQERQVSIKIEAMPIPPFFSHKIYISFVVRNLLQNAIACSLPGSEVRVTIKKLDYLVQLSVFNKSLPISDEAQKNLFRIHKAISEEGTIKVHGFGLKLSKKFLEQINGAIWYQPEEDGSKFIVSLLLNKNGKR